jgi:hypothetical protein
MTQGLTALILDRYHHVLVYDGTAGQLYMPGCTHSDLSDFCEILSAEGFSLPAPVGVDPPRYSFLLESVPSSMPSGWAWVPLKDISTRMSDDKYWRLYCDLMLGGRI